MLVDVVSQVLMLDVGRVSWTSMLMDVGFFQVHVNGYSNGYGSGSDMEITDDLQDVDSDVDDMEELPFPPTPPMKVTTTNSLLIYVFW